MYILDGSVDGRRGNGGSSTGGMGGCGGRGGPFFSNNVVGQLLLQA